MSSMFRRLADELSPGGNRTIDLRDRPDDRLSSGCRPPDHALAGVHPGCYELFAHEPVRTISDLKGKRVGSPSARSERPPVPRDPLRRRSGSIRTRTSSGSPVRRSPWSCSPRASMPLLASSPEPQDLRARKIGTLILNLATDKPWSQYFCCIVAEPGLCSQPSAAPNARCGRSSKLPTSARPSRSGSRGGWSITGSRPIRLRGPDR